jgi:hypothetical protein
MASSGIEWVRRRVLYTLIPAFLGGTAGALYARSTLPPEVFAMSWVRASYAAGGAATMILALRITTIIRLFIRDLRPPKEPPEGE